MLERAEANVSTSGTADVDGTGAKRCKRRQICARFASRRALRLVRSAWRKARRELPTSDASGVLLWLPEAITVAIQPNVCAGLLELVRCSSFWEQAKFKLMYEG